MFGNPPVLSTIEKVELITSTESLPSAFQKLKLPDLKEAFGQLVKKNGVELVEFRSAAAN